MIAFIYLISLIVSWFFFQIFLLLFIYCYFPNTIFFLLYSMVTQLHIHVSSNFQQDNVNIAPLKEFLIVSAEFFLTSTIKTLKHH